MHVETGKQKIKTSKGLTIVGENHPQEFINNF